MGDSDRRVPPHQSYFYYNCLKNKGVDCKLYDYPGSGHSIAKTMEHFNDANINISLWMDKYLNEPFRKEKQDDEIK